MSQIIVPSKRIWTRQPQRPQPLVRAIAEINPIGANFAVDASLQGKPFAKTSQYEPAIRVQQGAKWYFHGETNVSNAYFAEFDAVPLSGEYTVVLEIFGNLYSKHTFLSKGVVGSTGISVSTGTSYSGDGSGALSMQVTHYGVALYSFPASSFKPKLAPCTIVITGKANDVAKCWINGVYIGSVAVGNLTADSTSPLRIGRPFGGDDKFFYGGISLGFVASKRVSDGLAQSISRNRWRVFEPRAQQTFISIGSGNSDLAAEASGASTASGSATLSAQVALAGVGVSVAGGAAVGSVAVPLSAAGISVSGGSANGTATVRISAAGLAQAAGQAGLSAAVLLQAAGAAQAAGNTALAALLNAQAAGAAQAGGSANLTGGAPGALSASGGSIASGSTVLSINVKLQATGAAQASGSANGTASAPGALSATGGSQSSGSGALKVTVQVSAAGFVQAMGAGRLDVFIPISASGGGVSGGLASLSTGGVVRSVARSRVIHLSGEARRLGIRSEHRRVIIPHEQRRVRLS
jgi:hypothetical protein